MPPIVCVVGLSDSGKTTFLEKLIAELKGRHYRVAAVKHDTHGFDLDKPGKDSWRLAQAGSDCVVISSAQRLGLIKNVERDSTLEELARVIGEDYDIILTEGFKQSRAPKIEVHRREVGSQLLCRPEELIAVATDEPLETDAPQFPLDDARGIADIVEFGVLSQRPAQEMTLYVNGAAVPLHPFVKDMMGKAVLGMVNSLKGVGDPTAVELTIRVRG